MEMLSLSNRSKIKKIEARDKKRYRLICRTQAAIKFKSAALLWKLNPQKAPKETARKERRLSWINVWLCSECAPAFARMNLKVCVFLRRPGSSGQPRASRCCWGGLELSCRSVCLWLLWLAARTDSSAHDCRKRSPTPFTLLKEPFINYTNPAQSWVRTKSEQGHRGENNSRGDMSGQRRCVSL